ANLSANATVDDARQVVDAIDADALQIHLNSAQELVMPEGDREFRHWMSNIERLRGELSIPIVVKEVGFGLSRETVDDLLSIGISAVDVSGRGGTNFAAIENSRRPSGEYTELAGWGQSTVNCLLDISLVTQQRDVTVFASGGVRGPLDVARALS
ncbi:alpha-hydroxy-acid oxidizing protein, partial [Acinetobacter baumannii]|uniref:alpha-hydroxy-acid oxidizing protein n=1 Tax=Acinetobacter baumannii TaxID=470 RepID=UPI00189AF570